MTSEDKLCLKYLCENRCLKNSSIKEYHLIVIATNVANLHHLKFTIALIVKFSRS